MNHPTELLTDYALGELSPEEAHFIDQHLRTCEACTAELHSLNQTLVSLSEALPAATPNEQAWTVIQQRIAAPQPQRRRLAAERPRWQAFALAASLLIAFSGLFWGWQTRQDYQLVQREQRKVAGWLSRPDVNAQQLTDAYGERLGSVLTLADGRALFILRTAPPAGSSYQAWGYGDEYPVALGLSERTLLEVPYRDYQVLELSLEPKRGSTQPTRPLGRVSLGLDGVLNN